MRFADRLCSIKTDCFPSFRHHTLRWAPMTEIRAIAIVGCILVSSSSSSIAATNDTERILDALDLKEVVLPKESNPNARACVDRQWPTAAKPLHAVLQESFSASELYALAEFFGSPSGRKWNARSAAQAKNANPSNRPVPIPEYLPGEREAVADFLASPAGKRLLSGSWGTHFSDTVKAVFFILGKDCYGK
jgi:hypothetical protein